MSEGRTPITNFRRWLKETPQPVALRLDENEKKTIKVSKQRACWSEAEKSVLAMDPTIVEALDNQGNILRAFRLKDDDANEPAKPPQQESWPSSELAQMAQIFTAAADRAASRHEAAYKMGFDRVSAFLDAMVSRHDEALQRAAQAEARLERERRQWLEAQLKAAGAPADDEDQSFNGLLGQLISGVVEKRMAEAMNGSKHPNGNGKDA